MDRTEFYREKLDYPGLSLRLPLPIPSHQDIIEKEGAVGMSGSTNELKLQLPQTLDCRGLGVWLMAVSCV